MDKENVEYIECTCGTEILRMSYAPSDDWPGLNIAFWVHGHGSYRIGFKERVRWIWHILRKGKPYDDMVILDTLKAGQMIAFTRDYIKWANKKIQDIAAEGDVTV